MKSQFTCKPLRVSSRALGKPSPPAVAEQLGLRQLGISKPGDALRRMLVLALQSRVLPTTSASVLDSLGHAVIGLVSCFWVMHVHLGEDTEVDLFSSPKCAGESIRTCQAAFRDLLEVIDLLTQGAVCKDSPIKQHHASC